MKTLNLFGPVNRLGMGVHFTNWAGHLQILGTRLFVSPKGPVDLEPKRTTAENNVLSYMSPERFDPRGLSISLWHLSNVADFAGSFRAIYTVFETTQLSQQELVNCQKVDAVIVPTHWAQGILRDQGVESHVIPEGVNQDVFSFGGTGLQGFRALNPLADEEVRFLSIGKLEKRKGMEVMLDALIAAAPAAGRPMHVLAQWLNPWSNYDHFAKFMLSRRFRTKETAGGMELWDHETFPIRVSALSHHSPLFPRVELVDMMRACHWGLFPYSAEGWCLPLHESMAVGLPPICQAYSGPTEFLKPGTYIPLQGQDVIAKDKLFFDGTRGTWRQVITDSLEAAILQAVRTSETDRVAMGQLASRAALEYTWDRAAADTLRVIKDDLHLA